MAHANYHMAYVIAWIVVACIDIWVVVRLLSSPVLQHIARFPRKHDLLSK